VRVANRQKVDVEHLDPAEVHKHAQVLKYQPVFVLARTVIELEEYGLVREVTQRRKIVCDDGDRQLSATDEFVKTPIHGNASERVLHPDEMLRKENPAVEI